MIRTKVRILVTVVSSERYELETLCSEGKVLSCLLCPGCINSDVNILGANTLQTNIAVSREGATVGSIGST